MTSAQNGTLQKPLRVWPAVVIVLLQVLLRFVLPVFWPETLFIGAFAGPVGALLIVIWWLFFSRAPWGERIGGVLLMIAAVYATSRLVHVSILKGAMGMLFYILATQVLALAFVIWAVATRNLSNRVRRVTMVATILLACGAWTLIRTGGFTGEFHSDFAWRWSQTPEEKLLAEAKDEPAPLPPASKAQPQPKEETVTKMAETTTATQVPTQTAPAVQLKVDWPGFRGPKRDSIIRGVRIKTDWAADPPKELWRRAIGPGWSSFAVAGDLVFTQEQRGDYEVVSCYNKKTGKPIWRHRDSTRFWESNAGAGPRGTPSLNNDRVYAFGATGILNALNATDGALIWSRNAASDTHTKIPGWGFSSSPLIVDDTVIIAVSGQLAAYDTNTGKPRWFGPKGKTDYSSPHLLTIDGVPQVLLLSGSGLISVDPKDGKKLWEMQLPIAARIVQPAAIANGDLLIAEGEGRNLHRIAVSQGSKGWKVKERWSTNGLKPYFNDFVIHKNYAYGFDGAFLSCIDLKDGQRKWKGGHYGAGQLILLADQDLILVVSEHGELALVKASPDQFTELAKSPAIEGKTWNHPALVRNVLLVRNGEEMAAFRLTRE
jgi:outer membrane protein assembly factor BamB